jgi:sedoheptulose-bisphosphatase
MVPDVNQMMVKGKGVFVNVNSPNTKSKLRTLYEVAPIGYLIEKAGGKSSDGEKSVLDIMIEQTVQTSQVCYGSAEEVARFDTMVGRKFM